MREAQERERVDAVSVGVGCPHTRCDFARAKSPPPSPIPSFPLFLYAKRQVVPC